MKPAVRAFITSLLPPLLLRYSRPWLTALLALPVVRVIGMVLLVLVLAGLFIPAGVIGLVVWLITGDAAAAMTAAAVVAGVALIGLLSVAWWLRLKWRRYRRRHFR